VVTQGLVSRQPPADLGSQRFEDRGQFTLLPAVTTENYILQYRVDLWVGKAP
jgi:hypothetical protein